ncbi:ABC-2 type transport system permease protein [Clostridium algifaecis]|uniref:Transport permease protein n=1 Tax=Clostridium algifaecis TaxID=1472040 RepID=A0ABS4KU75_9CLOT|nr:ABC transporter permease [Clostridium algifaecis]MBP2033601.1 ABC-2 type transport system permease protein [Clostridium algifaecis]
MKINKKEKGVTFTAFKAMIKRDLVIQLRDKWEFIFRVVMLPLILILTYGYILPRIGLLPTNFPNRMFSGMIGMSMLVTGIHGTAIPFTMDFNNLREIEDRLLAPVHINIIALEKMVVGIIESFIGGLIVLPVSLIFMGNALDFSVTSEQILMLIPVLILISIASACLGLLVGTIIKPMQIAAMFPGFLMPMVFLGAVFFSWGDLSAAPIIQKIVLVNPLVYANEALRAILTPQIVHMPMLYSIAGLIVSIFIMGYSGKKRFTKMATGAE